jgi:membrane glycosyltransferase
MVPRPWVGVRAALRAALAGHPHGAALPAPAPAPWEAAARARRRILLLAVVASALGAAWLLAHAQGGSEGGVAHGVLLALHAVLFAWVTAGFVTALMGFAVLLRGDPHALSVASVARRPIHVDARTAIVMPICNEDVSVVVANLRATCVSLAATGAARLFDVYLLSDTSDPQVRVDELAAWERLREELGEGARVYYRWRRRRTRRKAGNVADFLRRWGRRYRYMVVLDADSVMSGDCLLSLLRLMEANPRAGILQTAPQACGLKTLHARSQQFAARVAGRLFTAGMQYWQLGESHYWGHNAIIRVEPFMRHCALAPLRGRHGTPQDILSHDFIEAALMRRAGYHVWLVPELAGSYEQQPPNLLAELQRDRRWCQGNLQNARLVAEPGLHAVHRAMLATGAMAYVSAPLWLAFVLLGAATWLGSDVPAGGHSVPVEMKALWACTFAMLTAPRLLGVLAILCKGELPLYGGAGAVLRGVVVEGVLSAWQAPIRMIAHSVFVITTLAGWQVDWRSPPRAAADVRWRDAARPFALLAVVVAAALLAVLAIDGHVVAWLLPVALPLLLAMPLVVLTSHAWPDRATRRPLLATPEEQHVPIVLRQATARAR